MLMNRYLRQENKRLKEKIEKKDLLIDLLRNQVEHYFDLYDKEYKENMMRMNRDLAKAVEDLKETKESM